jgi:fructose/tagatose bisphosphate aldolase
LGGELDHASAVLALQDDALMAHPEATLKFVNEFRGYALAYAIGTTTGVEAVDGTATCERRWRDVVRASSDSECS